MSRRDKYESIIQKAKAYYSSFHPELINLCSGDILYDLVWFPELSEEINLWTYWQGRGNLDTTEILLIGQDFGSYKINGEINPFLLDCLKSKDSR